MRPRAWSFAAGGGCFEQASARAVEEINVSLGACSRARMTRGSWKMPARTGPDCHDGGQVLAHLAGG